MAKQPTPDPNNILIFDWDDTICPSSAIDVHKAQQLSDLPLEQQKLFNEISQVATKTLSLACELGTTLIITNSDDGWVRFSARKFMPEILPALDDPRIEIVSARTRYESLYPGQPLCWKAAAFAHEVNERFQQLDASLAKEDENDTVDCDEAVSPLSTPRYRRNSIVMTDVEEEEEEGEESVLQSPQVDENKRGGNGAQTVTPPGSMEKSSPMDRSIDNSINDEEGNGNDDDDDENAKEGGGQEEKKEEQEVKRPRRQVVSFGDSLEERTACKIVASQLNATPKSVKFLSHPKPVLILGQLEMLNRYMGVVVAAEEQLDLEISQAQALEEAERRFMGIPPPSSPCKEGGVKPVVGTPVATTKRL